MTLAVDIEAAVKAALEATGVPFELLPCDPAFADTAAFCQRYGFRPEQSVNTIIVASKAEPRQYVACAVAASTRLDVNGTVRRRLGVKRASFATAEETRELTGMMLGGVTALALPPAVPLWVDERVMALPEIILGGGSRSLKVKVSPSVFARLPNTTVVAGLATSPAAGGT